MVRLWFRGLYTASAISGLAYSGRASQIYQLFPMSIEDGKDAALSYTTVGNMFS